MNKLIIFFMASMALTASARADDQYGGFAQYVTAADLKPFTRDLGGIIGAATFNNGRSLGFSGFDVGAHGGMQFSPDRNDNILRNNGVKAFGLPWVQAEIGLPFRLDGFIRGISDQGMTIAGGGLRYGLLAPSDKPWTPQVLVSAVAHSVVDQDFSASHYGASLVGSMGTARVTPYVGAGFDRTRLVVRAADDAALIGTSATAFESRFTAGIRVKPWTFSYLSIAYVLLHGRSGAEAGVGVRF